MDEAAVRTSLRELSEVIAALPFAGSDEGVYESDAPAEDVATEQLINCLRVEVKYLLFDLEATRRENRYLRQMLETRSQPNSDADGDWDDPPTV